MPNEPSIEIDGSRFDDLDTFWVEISSHVIPGAKWGRNLDAFNDILRGGFGTPDGGFVLRWINFQRSRESLSYPATLSWLRQKIQRCHPENVVGVQREIEAAERGEGPTILDTLLEIIRRHGPGGVEEEDGVELELA